MIIGGEISAYYPYYYDDYYRYRESERFIDRVILYSAGGIATLVITAYLYGRESNGSAIGRVNKLYSNVYYQAAQHANSLVSFAQNADISADNREQLFRARYMMAARYKSWVKPWDWSSGMQKAYEKIRVATILGCYLPLMLKTETLTGEDMSKFARETFAVMSKYPCIVCVASLDEDIVYVRNQISGAGRLVKPELIPLLQQLLPVLEQGRSLLRSEKEYLDEVRTKTTHDNQETQMLISSLCRR